MLKNAKRVIGLVFALVLAVVWSADNAVQGATLYWNVGGNQYEFRQEITISSAVTGTDLTDYPLLVQSTDVGNPVFTNAIDGTDIIFTADDGVTQLSREIETFTTGGTPELAAWVKTDVSSSMDTKLYMYYNGPSEANSTDTWDSNYKLIQHLQEDPTGTLFDSTSNNNDGTSEGAMTGADQVSGRIGGALDFDGSNDQINLGNDSSLFPTDVTLEAWAQSLVIDSHDGIFTNKADANHGLNLQTGTTQQLSSLVGDGGAWTYVGASGTSDPVLNTWYHLAITHDSGTNTNNFYVNGVLEDTDIRGLAYTGGTQPDVRIGTFYSSSTLRFNGIIDEVRLSDSVRSSDWIAAQVLLVNNPGLLSFGAEELPPVPEPSSFLLLGLGALGLLRHAQRRRPRD